MTLFNYLASLNQAFKQAALEINQRLTTSQLQELDDLYAQIKNSSFEITETIVNDLEDAFEQVWLSPMPTMKYVATENFERNGHKLWHATYLYLDDEYVVVVTINFIQGCDPEVSQYGIPISG